MSDKITIMTDRIKEFFDKQREYMALGQRTGQAAFNAYSDVDPEGARDLTGTAYDPFYTTSEAIVETCVDHMIEELMK